MTDDAMYAKDLKSLTGVMPATNAREIGSAFAFFGEDTLFDHGLGGDAGMIRAGQPHRVVAEHAMPTREDVLQRVVQRMAQMQGGGDVGWGDDDRVGIARRRGFGVEEFLLVPHAKRFEFDARGFVRFGELGAHAESQISDFKIEISDTTGVGSRQQRASDPIVRRPEWRGREASLPIVRRKQMRFKH